MPGEGGAREVSGGGGASGRGGGEPESEGLVATEGHGGNNWTLHIVKDDFQGFPVAVEGHDVLGEIQHDTHSISLPEQVVFATEGVVEGAPVSKFLCGPAGEAPRTVPNGTRLYRYDSV